MDFDLADNILLGGQPVNAVYKGTTLVWPFTPERLFRSGEQGVWYDPSDMATMFQDAAGTMPVTAMEQPVGLILDKSKGLVLGSESVVSPYSGSAPGSWVISATSVTRNGTTSAQCGVVLTSALSATKMYRVSFDVANLSGDTFTVSIGGANAGNITTNGSKSFVLTGGGISIGFIPWNGTAGQVTITNISVRELPGNHASQPTATSRPVLSARYNLLTKSDSLGPRNGWAAYAGAWTGTYTTAPDGSNTAMSIKNVSESVNQYFYVLNGVATAAYRMSVWAKPNTGSSIDLFEYYTNNEQRVRFSLVGSGSIVLNVNGYNAGISKHPTVAGWYYCFVDIPITAGLREFDFVPSVADTEVFMWAADLRVANIGVNLPPYQRVNTATDYDTAGFPAYLKFDGSDDFLVTNNIDFTATDKVGIFAGLRKLSDTGAGNVVELSTATDTNNGSFAVTAPDSASATFAFESKGTVLANRTVGGVAAPVTGLFTGIGNIAGDNATVRFNGLEISTLSDQGTGNYGNYPLYIGRRAGTTLPFNGHIYSLVIRGEQTIDSTLEKMERYVNQKTNALDWDEISETAAFRWNSATASPDAE